MTYLILTQFGTFKEKIHIQDYVFPYILHYFIKIYYYLQPITYNYYNNKPDVTESPQWILPNLKKSL